MAVATVTGLMVGVGVLLGMVGAMVVIEQMANRNGPWYGSRLASKLALLSGVLALCLAAVAFLHIPIVKYSTEWELERMEAMLAKQAVLPGTEAQEWKLSIQKVRNNHLSISRMNHALRQRATLGFVALSVLAFLVFGLLRRSRLATGASVDATL